MSPIATLARRLGLIEALGISIALLCPSVGMAFNVTLSVQAAGAAAPLTFVLGTTVALIVALSFVAFSRRIPHAGAAYAYVADAFGPWLGTVAGWTLMLVYFAFSSSEAALTASFVIAAFGEAGVHAEAFGLPIAAASVLACAWLARRDAQLASRLMLGLEFVSMAAIFALAMVILRHVAHAHAWSSVPFSVRGAPGGWSALGYGLVFAILSLAGFESAATLSEETINPRRAVSIAMLGSLLGAGLFFVIVSYAVVMGYGLNHMDALANAQAPLDALARENIGPIFAGLLNAANAISAFGGLLAALTGAVRLLFALSRAGLAPRLAVIDPVHRTPAHAVFVVAILVLVPLCLALIRVRPADYCGYLSTIGALACILVYAAVTIAETVEAIQVRRAIWAILGITGTGALGWSMLCSIVPVPPPPANFWPYLVMAWVSLGAALPLLRPSLRRHDHALPPALLSQP